MSTPSTRGGRPGSSSALPHSPGLGPLQGWNTQPQLSCLSPGSLFSLPAQESSRTVPPLFLSPLQGAPGSFLTTCCLRGSGAPRSALASPECEASRVRPIPLLQVAAFLVSPEGDGALRASLCLFPVGVVVGMPQDVCLCRVGGLLPAWPALSRSASARRFRHAVPRGAPRL